MKNNCFIKNRRTVFSIIIICFFIFLLFINYFKIVVYAANVSGLTVDGLTATYDNGTWSGTGTGLSGSATGSAGGRCSDPSSTTSTLTLKNTKGTSAKLSFTYQKPVLASGGSVKINGAAVTTAGSFDINLANNASITIVIFSGNAGANTSSIVIENIQLVAEKQVTTTFTTGIIADSNTNGGGTYSVNGTTVSETLNLTQASTNSYALIATAAPGYRFFGWKSSISGFLSQDASVNLMFEDNQTITPVFTLSSNPTFEVGNEWFAELSNATISASNKNISQIALIYSGTVSSGTYTIPSGKTLLIPYDNLKTIVTDTPEATTSYATPTAYKTLILDSGVTINVNGSISVASKLSASGQNANSYNGTPSGPGGRIEMKENSVINLNNGANLYCWGYITYGTRDATNNDYRGGYINAKNGSKVYEAFQIRSWRGGSALSGGTLNLLQGKMNPVFEDNKIFPLNQYYVQNIEVKIVFNYGCEEIVYTYGNANSSATGGSATFISHTSSGMFRMSSGSKLTKQYNPVNDRVTYIVDGNVSVSSISLTIAVFNINTANFVLPIQSNITIQIISGTTTVEQDIGMLPGSELIIENGCNLNISSGKNVYVYDKSEWGNYAADSLQLVPVKYVAATSNSGNRTTDNLVDAIINVNGTINLNGYLYTTSSGANICSSEKSGQIIYNVNAGTASTTYQATQSGTDMTAVSISITSAKLLNGDGSYTPTSGTTANTTFFYCSSCSKWQNMSLHTTNTVTYNANGGIGTMGIQRGCSDHAFNLNPNVFSKDGFEFAGWNTSADGSGDSYINKQLVTLTSNLVLYAQWLGTKTVITLNQNGATTTGTSTTNAYYGSNIVSPVITNPTKTGSTFLGWFTAASSGTKIINVDGSFVANSIYTSNGVWNKNTSTPVTLFAQWSEVSYTIRFLNYDGTVLETVQVGENLTPEYSGETPVRLDPSNINKYTFSGWTPSIVPATSSQDYTATFTWGGYNTYNIIYHNVLEDEFGENTPFFHTYNSSTELVNPTKTGYIFIAWYDNSDFTGSPITSLGATDYTDDIDLYAKWQIKTYTITWYNYDGTLLETDYDVSYGTIPSYDGQTPEKPETSQYIYQYTGGWSDVQGGELISQLQAVNCDEDYYAYFIEWEKLLITYMDAGNLPFSGQHESGYPTYHLQLSVTHLKSATKEHYTFGGWYKESDCSGTQMTEIPDNESTAITLYAKWIIDTFEITWKNDDGTTIDTTTVDYNTVPTHADATKVSTAEYDYTFAGWTPELVAATTDATYTATYTPVKRSYTITWKMDDNSTIDTTTVEYGVIPTHSDPNKTQTDVYTYTFTGWDPEVVAVTGIATYTATFSQTARKYPIHFVYDGITKDFEFTLVSNFTFPQGSVFEGSHSYSVKKWINDTLDNQEPNDSLALTLSYNGVTFNAFTGGFYDEGVNRYYIEPTRDTFTNGMIKGLYKIKTYDGSSIKIHYFDEVTGILHTDSSIYEFSGDNNYYKVESGYVNSTEGLSKDSNNYYYYTTDKNYLLKSGYHYLYTFNSIGDFKNGYYGFTSGKLDRVNVNNDATKLNKTYIDSNILYYDGIKVPYGLYKDTSNKLHYALYDGNLVNNESVYIVSDKANSYNTYTNYLCKFKAYKMYNPYKKEDITYEG